MLHEREDSPESTSVCAVEDVLRRRSVGAPAARSTLLTVLGEYLLQRPEGAWQEGLIAALNVLGFSPSAARQAVVRSTREGWLEGERVGRRSRMRLTPSSAALLRDGARRIYGFGGPVSWDGRWLLRRAARAGAAPRAAPPAHDAARVGGLRLARQRPLDHAARGPRGADQGRGAGAAAVLPRRAGRARARRERVLDEAWDLPGLREHYEQFIDDFAQARPSTGAETFAAQTAIVHAWRRFPFIDPDLPDDLLPRDWPRRRALRAVPRPPRALGRRGPGALRRADAMNGRKRIYVAYVGGTIGMQADRLRLRAGHGAPERAGPRAPGAQRARGARTS